jgi:hypothetical protein
MLVFAEEASWLQKYLSCIFNLKNNLTNLGGTEELGGFLIKKKNKQPNSSLRELELG